MLETIATSNNGQYEAPKNVKPEKTEVSDKVDYNLDGIDEQKFQEFKKMTDYIKENGGEYKDEYEDIMNRVIKPFEEKIQSILNRNKETGDLDSLSDEEVNRIANEVMERQPEEFTKQQELIRKINSNGSSEEIHRLNEMVNENKADVQKLYDKIKNNMN
jgi:rRNA maturation endonuclease Nob1